MVEEFSVGDKVVYQDAYTGDTKYGVILHMNSGDAIIRTITEKEAGASPKRLPKLRIACTFTRDENGNAICGYHRQPLNELSACGDQPNPPGLGHFSAWVCPITAKQVYDAGF